MAKSAPFSPHEAVLLLDAYLTAIATDQPMMQAVKQASSDLRKMALNNGAEIDDKYRNVNGISFQMERMKSSYAGKTSTKLFTQIVALFRENRSEYDKILKEAKAMVNGEKDTKTLFADWLNQTLPSTHYVSKLFLCYPAIEAFCLKIRVLHQPLFKTTDVETVRRVQRVVNENRLFQLTNNKQMKMMIPAAQYYLTFIKALNEEREKEKKPIVVQAPAPVSVNEEKAESSPKAAEPPRPEHIEKKKHLTVDFCHIDSLAFTKPLSVSYFDKTLLVGGTWAEVYCKLMKALYEDYPTAIPVGKSFSGAARVDFGNYQQALYMNKPKPVCQGLYLETCLSATDIVLRIKMLLDICRVDYENVVIEYVNKNISAKMPVISNPMAQPPIAQNPPALPRAKQKIYVNNAKTRQIDFRKNMRLSYTRPVKVIYFGKHLPIDTSWQDAYIQLVSALYEDYPNVIPIKRSFIGVGRVDLGTREYTRFMTTPKPINSELYLETNQSAVDIVKRMKALLDICHVDYNCVEIYYEDKDIPKRGANKAALHASASNNDWESSNLISSSERKVSNSPSESAFYSFMCDTENMADATCRGYVSAATIAERYAREHHFAHCQIFNCPVNEAQNTINTLFSDADFLKYNRQQHNRFRAAISKLLECMGEKRISLSRSARTVPSSPVPPPRLDLTPFAAVLEQRFVKGFRLGSTLDMKKFNRYYEEIHGTTPNIDDAAIEEAIRSCGIVYEGKVFLPKTMLSDEVKARLLAFIDNTFQSGKSAIYFEALFSEFSEDFLDHYIYNADMLRSYLAFECGDKYVIGKNQISKEAGVNIDPIEEVRACLKAHGEPMEKDALCAALSHLPQSKIINILGSNLEFVRNAKGEFFHADLLALTEDELEDIAALIEDALRAHDYMSGTELMNAIRAKYPSLYEDYAGYSDIGWRDALKYKFGRRFSFRGNIISRAGVTLSMCDVFARLAADAESITMSELLAFAESMGTVVYLDAVYQNALRINEDTFVSKKRAAFQVRETDRILDRFCTGNDMPLSDVHDFGIFPDAGFPWTVYLLESYVAFYSERYTLLHANYNQSCAVGAVVKKSAGYDSLDDLLVNVLADSGIPLTKTDALDYLVNAGYLARRSYTNIEALLLRAGTQRNEERRM